MTIQGLTDVELQLLVAVARTATPHEAVILRLAARMAEDGEGSGARWLVRRVIRRRRGGDS